MKIGLGQLYVADEESRKNSSQYIIQRLKHLPYTERESAVDVIAQQARMLPGSLMLTTGQLRALNDDGIEIGAHTHSHPILATLDPDDAIREIETGKGILERLLGRPVSLFAYPNGKYGADYNEFHRDAIKELGFDAGLTTEWGVADRRTDRWQLPRFTPWDRERARFLLRLLWNRRNLIR